MRTASPFSDEVVREIRSAVRAADVTSRVSHLELALLHFEASGQAPDDAGRCRQMIETAVFTQIALAERSGK